MSTSTKLTIDSKRDTVGHSFFLLGNDSVVARKHRVRTLLSKSDCADLRKVEWNPHIDFFQMSPLAAKHRPRQPLPIRWPMYGCSGASFALEILLKRIVKGTSRICGDVIEKGSLQMDWFFKYALIRDICEAVHFLHHSSFGAHGWLSSCTCLVDERWQVKVTYYGLDTIKSLEVKEQNKLLWTAPEHIRDPLMKATKEGDIYRLQIIFFNQLHQFLNCSFAIICSEIVTKKSPWDLENQEYDLDELIYKIKRGGRAPIRPSLDTDDEHNASMSLLIRDCWAEEPDQRPSTDQIKSLIKGFNHNKSSNLMDHVFNVLEQYASNLEEEKPLRHCHLSFPGPSKNEGTDRREEEKRYSLIQNATKVSKFSSICTDHPTETVTSSVARAVWRVGECAELGNRER
ncbi:unnamed protein product, partial [Cylicostephanus goldi]